MAQPTRKRLPPEERRAQLLDTALAVVARRGFGRAGHTEIAEAAGVAVSTVFLYFPTRKDLLEAVLAEVGRFYLELAVSVHSQALGCREVLALHRYRFHESLETHPNHARIALDWSTAMREELWPLYLEFIEQLVANHVLTIERGQRAGEVSEGVDPETSAHMLIGSSQMTAQLKLTGTDPDRVDRIAAMLIDTALGRLTPASTPSSPPPSGDSELARIG